jgi:hypothetical protein
MSRVGADGRAVSSIIDTTGLAGTDYQIQITQYDLAGQPYRTLDNLGRINQTNCGDLALRARA